MVTLLLIDLDVALAADVSDNLKPELMSETTMRKSQNRLKSRKLPAKVRLCNLKRSGLQIWKTTGQKRTKC